MTSPHFADLPRHLAHLHYSRSSDLSHIRRWTFGTVTGPIARVAAADTHTNFLASALTAQAFTLWHSGKKEVHYGKTGTNLGRAMRQLGTPDGFGYKNPTVAHLFDLLLAASTGAELQRHLTTIMKRLRHNDHPPHWETLAEDLARWLDPQTRNQVRIDWATSFTAPFNYKNTTTDGEETA